METIKKLNKWTNHHNPYFALDVLRWFLGGFLFFKGINFMSDSQYLLDIISPNRDFFASMIIYQYVTMVHLVLQAIADGMSTKQAGRHLGITTKTVHNHLNAIYRKLDAQSLTHAVLGAVRLGIIDLNHEIE